MKLNKLLSLGLALSLVAMLFLALPASNALANNAEVDPTVGNTYYVNNLNPIANDTNPGTILLPLRTIGRGEDIAFPGDTVRVLAGTYPESVIIERTGQEGLPITFQADPGVTVTGDVTVDPAIGGFGFALSAKQYIVIDGFTITHTPNKGIYVNGSSYITIQNNHVNYAGKDIYGQHQEGIFLTNTQNSKIAHNTTDHNTCIGIRLAASSNNNVISNNISYANVAPLNTVSDAAGIEIDDSSYNTVIHNITFDNEDSGINLYIGGGGGSTYNYVVSNLSYGNRDHGIDNNSSPNQIIVGNTVQGNFTSGINLELNSSGATLMNNIVSDNGLHALEDGRKAYNIYVDGTSYIGTNLDYNLYHLSPGNIMQIKWNGVGYASIAEFKIAIPGQELAGLEGNPLFSEPAVPATKENGSSGGDYYLSAGSPAIDSANSDAPYEPNVDIEGSPRVDDPDAINTGAGTRPYDDRGAYERTGIITTSLAVDPINSPYGNTINPTATLSPAIQNKIISFTLNGEPICTGLTNSSGQATCSAALKTHVNTYPTGVAAAFAGDARYLASNNTASLTVTSRDLTVAAIGVNKEYDSLTTATVTLSDNKLAGDDLTSSYTSAAFANKNVGIGKTVSVSGINLSGTDAVNYNLLNLTASTTADITARHITGSFTADNKIYDRTTNATVLTRTPNNIIVGDTVTLIGGTAAFADKNVGNGKVVTLIGAILSGTDQNNYALDSVATAAANITKRDLTVGATGVNKAYDGTTIATVNLTDDRIAGDVLTTSYASASFDNKNAGIGKPVGVTGISISSTDAGNYNLLNMVAATTANITQKQIAGTFSSENKVYDGTTAATVVNRQLSGVLDVDNVSLTGGTASFANKNVGVNKTVTLTGATLDGTDKNNYTLSSVATTTANITARELTVAATGVNKPYDGKTDATVTLSDNRVAGDVLTPNYTSATFENADAGTGKTVHVSGISISGVDAGNYHLVNETAITTADITGIAVTVTVDTGLKKLFGESDPVFTYSYDPSDPPLIFTGALSREPGETVGTYQITLGTLSAGPNYQITLVSADFTIEGFLLNLPFIIN